MGPPTLLSIPRELRAKIISSAAPDTFYLQLDKQTSTIRHRQFPLLGVSRDIRVEALDLIQRDVPVHLSSPEALDHITTPSPHSPFFPGIPRHLHIVVLQPHSAAISHLPKRVAEDAVYAAPLKSLLATWGSLLARLPSSTRSLVLDYSHTGYTIRSHVLGGLVQRVATRLWIVSKNKTEVRIVGCNTAYGRMYLEGCIPGPGAGAVRKPGQPAEDT